MAHHSGILNDILNLQVLTTMLAFVTLIVLLSVRKGGVILNSELIKMELV